MNDVWAHRVLRERGVETELIEGAPAEVAVLVETLQLAHHGPGKNYRPYLHLHGELRSVRPHGQLPHGVDEVLFPPGGGDIVDGYYEFDDVQLTELTRKGYFSPGFTVPEQVAGIEWSLPATVDALVLAPAGPSGTISGTSADVPDIPVVFVRVHNLGNLSIDLESSGYDLVPYFADHSTDRSRQEEQQPVEENPPVRTDAIVSLFDDAEFERPAAAASAVETGPGTARDAKEELSVQLQAVAAGLDAEAEQDRRSREARNGTFENVYRERIAGALETKAGKEAAPEPRDTDQFAQEENTGPSPAENTPVQGSARLEELKRTVSRRASELERHHDHATPHRY